MINDLTETIINGCCLKSTERSTKRVCLFGTSANPPTGMGGHVGIASHLASTKQGNDAGLPIFDEVRILPVYSHVFNVSSQYLVSTTEYYGWPAKSFDAKTCGEIKMLTNPQNEN